MREKLPVLAFMCDRYAVSDRTGAAIATAVLQDFGIVANSSSVEVIDRHKLRRERSLKRNKRQQSPVIEALYFDGCKDVTLYTSELVQITTNASGLKNIFPWCQNQVLYTYIGHVTPPYSTAKEVHKNIAQFFSAVMTLSSC